MKKSITLTEFCCTLTLIIWHIISQGQIITSVAGTGISGYNYDGIAAISAKLSYPSAIFVDVNGNMYIADANNNRIRKVTASTGIITTVAGGGTGGLGDGGLATSAKLFTPFGVFVDSLDNIFIADKNNFRIRKVEASTGIINTIAGIGTQGFSGDGGLAINSELNSPSGVSVDNLGNVYIADGGNNRIRKINVSTGIINTIAGTGFASFGGDGGLANMATLNFPYCIFLDGSNNIYFSDRNNKRIRKITSSTNIINTVAGNGITGFSGDGASAINAKLNNPFGVAVDAMGNVYIADAGNNRIRKVEVSTGIISTVAGNGIIGYSGDGSLATQATINNPYGVFVDIYNSIYIADTDNSRIRKVFYSPTSLLENEGYNTKLVVSPNPTSNKINIIGVTGIVNITLFDMLGNEVMKTKLNDYYEMDISHLTTGLYFIEVKTSRGFHREKFVKE
jgi:hypothetical protein